MPTDTRTPTSTLRHHAKAIRAQADSLYAESRELTAKAKSMQKVAISLMASVSLIEKEADKLDAEREIR
jgi:uncharacterized protein (DUF3084 family)